MSHLLRALLAVLFALWLAGRSPSFGGGDNPGGTGVWILPCAMVITETTEEGGAPSRGVFVASSLQQDLKFAMSNEVGMAVATCVDDFSGAVVSLPVTGSMLTVPSSLVQSLTLSPMRSAHIVVADASQVGYRMTLTVDPAAGTVTVRVR